MSFYECSDLSTHAQARVEKNQPVTSMEYSSTGKSAQFSIHFHSDLVKKSC